VSKKQRLGVSLALLAWLAWHTDWEHVRQAFGQLRWGLWIAALGLYVTTQAASSLRWQWLAQPLGFQQPLRRYLSYYFVGMYFNLLLPTSVGGDVVRAWYLARSGGRRVDALLSVFVDRLSGLALLLILACAATAWCPAAVPRWVPWSVWGSAAGILSGLTALSALALWTRRFERVRRLMDGVRLYLHRPGLLLGTAALSLVVQAANVVLVWWVGLALGVNVPAAYYWILVPMVTLLTLLPVSLNGMGIREGGTVLFLAPMGVNAGTALSLAFLWFAVFTTAALVGAGVYLFGRFPRPVMGAPHEPVGGDSDQGRTGQPRAAA
jgi:uncharacterized membrane protein YbhN (UPF0104 family)